MWFPSRRRSALLGCLEMRHGGPACAPLGMLCWCGGGISAYIRVSVELSETRFNQQSSHITPGGGRQHQSSKHSIETLTVSMGVAPAVARDFQGAASARGRKRHTNAPGPGPGRARPRLDANSQNLEASVQLNKASRCDPCCTARRMHDDACTRLRRQASGAVVRKMRQKRRTRGKPFDSNPSRRANGFDRPGSIRFDSMPAHRSD